MFLPWFKLAADTTLLAIESHMVITTRLTQIATGSGTAAEAQLMVTEKLLAFTEAAMTLAAGGSAHKVVRGYRKHVGQNVRRLRRR